MKSIKRVNFEDCDPYSHLNNAHYLSYFLNAREEQLRTNHILDVFEHAKKTGKGWAVVSHNIRYLKPARMGEDLEIWSRMLTFDALRNLVEFVMISPKEKQVKSVMLTMFAYFSIEKARPVKLEKELLELYKRIAIFPGQDINAFDIEERIRAIKSELTATGRLDC